MYRIIAEIQGQIPTQVYFTIFGLIYFTPVQLYICFYRFELIKMLLTVFRGSGLNRAQTAAMPLPAAPSWTSFHTWRKPKQVILLLLTAPECVMNFYYDILFPSHAVSNKTNYT